MICSNEFAALYHNPEAEQAIQNCKAILRYCASGDPQAERVLWIVEAFDQANKCRPAGTAKLAPPGRETPLINTLSRNAEYDPMTHFFTPNRPSPQKQSLPSLPPVIKHERPAGLGGASSGRPPVLPSVRPQPSPEGSGASPVNTGPVTSSLHGLDVLGAPEAEFDFESLWPPNWQTTAGPVLMLHHHHAHQPHLAPAGEYAAYGLGQGSVALGNVLSGAANVPPYPASNFR